MRYLLFLAFLSASFAFAANAVPGGPVIFSEIAWMGSASSTYAEWIELKNLSSEEICLSGYVIEAEDGNPLISLQATATPGGFLLLERTSDDTVPGRTADQVYSGALGNDGETLYLKNSEGEILDSIISSGAWAAGSNESKQTMSRDEALNWRDSLLPGGTPGVENDFAPPASGEADSGASEGSTDEQAGSVPSAQPPGTTEDTVQGFEPGSVVINEMLSDPSDGGAEWVELYNKSSQSQNLSACRFEEGSASATTLEGYIAAKAFFVLENPKGYLNNKGDELSLICNGRLEDRLTYGQWQEKSYVTAPRDGQSLARRVDGLNTFNNEIDFSPTSLPSPGASNKIAGPSDRGEAACPEGCEIYFSEVLPDPEGDDNVGEFIELYNPGPKDLDLSGWTVADKSGRSYVFGSQSANFIPALAYFVLPRSESRLVLNNDTDSLLLYPPGTKKAIASLEYKGSRMGQSFNCPGSSPAGCFWSNSPTPGQGPSKEPVKADAEQSRDLIADFFCPDKYPLARPYLFDGSDSWAASGSRLRYLWDFGDGFTNTLAQAEHTYFKPGVYRVDLKVSDGRASSSKSRTIEILDEGEKEPPSSGALGAKTLMITEILPNPEKDDHRDEFIEIYNFGSATVRLLGWALDDVLEGGSKPFYFKDGQEIESQEYIAVYSEESKLALNNNFDSVNLLDAEGGLIDQIAYEKAEFKQSYSRGLNNRWFWTQTPTPGRENVIDLPDDSSFYAPASIVKGEVQPPFFELSDLSGLEKGQSAQISGVVVVEPGVLGTQFFYLADSEGGIQIYSYKKDFPELERGLKIAVKGELSEVQGEKRLKISSRDDIAVLGREELVPAEISCADLEGVSCGSLVSVDGEIIERKGSSLYLDDGDAEAKIYIKKNSGLVAGSFTERDQAVFTGVVGMISGEKVVFPRSIDDVVRKNTAQSGEPRVLGEIIEADEWALPPRNPQTALYKYLLIISFAIIFYLAALLVKEKFWR